MHCCIPRKGVKLFIFFTLQTGLVERNFVDLYILFLNLQHGKTLTICCVLAFEVYQMVSLIYGVFIFITYLGYLYLVYGVG